MGPSRGPVHSLRGWTRTVKVPPVVSVGIAVPHAASVHARAAHTLLQAMIDVRGQVEMRHAAQHLHRVVRVTPFGMHLPDVLHGVGLEVRDCVVLVDHVKQSQLGPSASVATGPQGESTPLVDVVVDVAGT